MWNDFKVNKKNKKFINNIRILNCGGIFMAKKNSKSKSKSKRIFSKKSKIKKTIIVLVLIVIIAVLAVVGSIKLAAIKKSNIVAYIKININIDNQKTSEELKITRQELDRRYDFLFFVMGYPEEYKQIITKEAILEQLVNEKLLLEEASKQDFDISNAEVDKRIKEMIAQNLMTEEQFKDRLNEGGFSFDYFKDYYKKQLIISEFINESIFSEIGLNDSEIREYYDNNKESYTAKEGEIRARHILVETKEEADDVLKELRKGADFAELAKEKSIGPSSVRGGDLGFFSKGSMVEEFEKVAFSLRTGEVSDPVKTDFGWHIIKREPRIISFEEAEDLIEQQLLIEKQKQVFEEYLSELKENSDVIVNLGMESATEFIDSDTENSSAENTCIDDYGISSDTIIFCSG